MAAGDTYASNIARIYGDLGRSQADARLQSGAAWQQAIGQVGQIAAGLPGQLADERRSRQQEAIWQANLDRFNQQRQEDQWLKDAMNSSVVNGEIDERRLTENLQLLGAAELTPMALQTVREAKTAAVQLRNAIQQWQIDEATLHKLQSSALAPYAKALVEAEGDPAVLSAALAAIRINLGPQMADALQQSIAENPAGVLPFAKSLLTPTEQEKPVVVAEGAALVAPSGQELYRNQGKPQTVDQMLAAALKAGDREEVNRLIKFKAQEAAATRAPSQGPQPSYQRIETVDAAGNPVIQYMTPEEVRKMGGVPTSPKTTAKASGPATVDAILGEIEGLSKIINTSAGGPMANVTGMMRRGAAASNLDNDVSEYTALVEGFIPMVARAVGHTGVLTQQDVDSVRALFPKPTDNATLAKNKLDRVRRIMQQMQSPDAPSGRASGAGPAKGGKVDPLGIRPGGGGL